MTKILTGVTEFDELPDKWGTLDVNRLRGIYVASRESLEYARIKLMKVRRATKRNTRK